MRNTIKAKFEYIVKAGRIVCGDGRKIEIYTLYDGNEFIMIAKKASWEQYKDEAKDNECFNKCEVFTSRKGKQYIYWRDEEADIDYLTPIEKKEA